MRQRETVLVRRPVQVDLVPYGTPVDLEEGTWAEITQALGTSFTLLVEGQLMRLRGSDADAIGKPVPVAVRFEAEGEVHDEEVERLVWEALRTCYDPEIPVNIVDLGLVYRCELQPLPDRPEKLHVIVDMTLTAPGCGMGEVIANEVNEKVLDLPRVHEATVNLVFDPPWNRSMMSEAALLALGM